jgi:MFS family permease
MYSEQELESAVAAGALTPAAAQAFRAHVEATRATPAADEESFRLLTGFNDIFVSIAAGILLFAVAWIGYIVPPHLDHGPTPFMGLFVAVTAWLLAEYFTRQRRMALPSIILLLAFSGGVFMTTMVLGGLVIGADEFGNNVAPIAWLGAFSAGVTGIATWLHWRRFMVPITVAAGAATVVGAVIALVLAAVGGQHPSQNLVMGLILAAGLAVFAFAMRWDGSDRARQTRRSDVAFWLHLLAAPMIAHPVFHLLGITQGDSISLGAGLLVVAIYVGFGIVALAVDRRALLVSALAYVLYALTQLFAQFGAVELNVALTAFVIGSALLLLSAFWGQARRVVVQQLPGTLRERLPLTLRPVAA